MFKQKFNVPDGWRLCKLTDVAHVKFSGVDKKTEPAEGLVRLCNYTDVFYNRYILNDLDFMRATATSGEIEKFRLKKGDVVFTKDSETAEEIGICASVEEELDNVICGYHLGIMRPKRNNVNGSYLSAVLNFHPIHWQFVRMANGITRFGLNLPAMDMVMVPIPPINEQVEIIDVIKTWDSCIEKTDRLLKAINSRHQALSVKLLSKVEHEIPLKRFLKLVLRAVKKPEDTYWALGIRSHGRGTFRRFIENPSTVAMDTLYRVLHDDLIVNITFAWEGAVALVNRNDEDCFVSHRFPTFEIDRKKALPDYLRHVIVQKRFIRNLGMISPGGAGRNRVLNKRDFLNLKISLPEIGEQQRIGDILNTSLREISLLQTKIELLKKQKSGLMQKIFTGEWRVKSGKEVT